MKKRLYKCILFFSFVIFYLTIFIKNKFNDMSFELLLYNITNTSGANYSIVLDGFLYVFFFVFLTFILYFILNKFKFFVRVRKIYLSLFCLFFSIIFLIFNLGIHKFLHNVLNTSNIFEEEFVDARDVSITFNDKKRNLIYIFVESLEVSNFSLENGGLVKKSYTPNLEKMAIENVSFSNNGELGGALQIAGTEWTKAALVAHTSAAPLKFSFNQDNIGSLPGLYTLGDVLADNGYKNYFMIGSDSNFGGRGEYFKTHGDYEIYDYDYAIENGLVDSGYHVWWGYEDLKLFDFAKDKILEVSNDNEPFNFTILTVDTHFTDGYMDSSCKDVFDKKYANAFYCSDSKIYDFVEWVKLQDFYDDTTIVIVGDHLTMQSNFYEYSDYDRVVYNAFINSKVLPINAKNRLFTTFDMFPTTLASLGADIEGERLGFGTNLFSDKKTLVEELGFDYFQNEISKHSNFYEREVLLNNKKGKM